MIRLGFAITLISLLAVSGQADAARHRHHHHHKRHHHHRVIKRKRRPQAHKPTVRPTVKLPAAPSPPVSPQQAASAPPPLVEAGNVPGCQRGADPSWWLELYHAQAIRIIVNPWHLVDEWAPCIRQAMAAGFRVHIVFQWWGSMSIPQTQAFFRQELPKVSDAWAISLGNEQELAQPRPGAPMENGATYAAYWQALEPIVQAIAPHALRVAGEASPWGISLLRDALAAGLPGVQVLSAHPYNCQWATSPADFLNLARFVHLPLWEDEGLAGPNAWPNAEVTRTSGELAGAAAIGAWIK